MAVSCASRTFCLGVDRSRQAVTFRDGSWSKPVRIAPARASYDLLSVSCPTSVFCMAVDGAGNARRYDGTTWTTVHIDHTALTGVSCPTAALCVAVDDSGYAITYNGVSWAAPVQLDSHTSLGLQGISCPTVSFCAVADGDLDQDGYAIVGRRS